MKRMTIVVAGIVMISLACNNEHKDHNANAGAPSDAHAGHGTTSAMPDAGATYADSVNSGIITADTLKGSVHRITMANIGAVHVHIDYSSPGVKGRIIWGGLVPFDQIWVAGAHKATSVDFSGDVVVGDKPVPKGKYAIFAIPGKENWTIILNKKWDQHLTDEYSDQEDVLRLQVKPQQVSKKVERLSYQVLPEEGTKGKISLSWDSVQVFIPVQAKS
ncbi:MAG: DUF2911 domain-containing protein [Chitinophagaceae bacterium]